MELIADRFVQCHDGVAIDLGTGDRVTLRMLPGIARDAEARWTTRCDTLRDVHHPDLARLVDYGPLDARHRFEAWRGTAWHGSLADADGARRRARAALGGIGTLPLLTDGAAILEWADAAVVAPDTSGDAGPPLSDRCRERAAPAIVCALPRGAAAIAEVLDAVDGRRASAVSLWGPPGCGKSTILAALVRLARQRGFVPVTSTLAIAVCSGALAPWWALLDGRTLVIVDDERGDGWTALAMVSTRSPRPHLLIAAGAEEPRGIEGVRVEPLSAEQLIARVRPAPDDAAARRRLEALAIASRGRPGRFARQLWAAFEATTHYRKAPPRVVRAAEQAAPYGAGLVDGRGVAARTPAPDVEIWRLRAAAADRQIGDGRHAPGERLLRQALAALARRDDARGAAESGLVLGRHLLSRGRADAARAVLVEATDWAARCGDAALTARAGALSSSACLDAGRLDEAGALARSAAAAARADGDAAAIGETALAVARCLFWVGRYGEASAALDQAGSDAGVHAARTRVTLGAGDAAGASRAASAALEAARISGGAAAMARAVHARVLVDLAGGDGEAVERRGRELLRLSRAARQPCVAASARLLMAEAARRQRSAPANELTRAAARLVRGAPFTIGARARLLRELAESRDGPAAILSRHVRATGLEALAIFAPAPAPDTGERAGHALVRELVDLLHACHTAADDRLLLADICARLRKRLGAAAVAFAGGRDSLQIVATDGARLDLEVAVRARTSGLTIAPHRCGERLEAAAPVRYGAETIGAIAARWTIGTAPDGSAAAVLTMAAAAAAPALAAALAAAQRPPAPDDLLGTSAVIGDLRRAVERAAGAPFPVLVCGESGSGKELVARAVHRRGPRRDRRFCALNCAALPDDLVEAELFGHARGAFTGAVAERAGVFEEAHGGTLFLDEIGELSLRAQAKLLRVVQEGELRRVGESLARRIDVRIVAATNRDLRAEASAGRFRVDLLYRLDVIRIAVPPLRDRQDDVPLLAEHFWRDAAARVGSAAVLATATIAALARYDWPGNIRELQNVLAALAVRAPRRGVVPPSALPPPIGGGSAPCRDWRLDAARRTFDEHFVRAALVRAGGHRGRAATELGLSRQGLTKLMARLGISDDLPRAVRLTTGE